ncbi:MAG TPA: NAD(P)/FAD-dependent oxidoreductase [Candidatus Pacearchaeota archaeon]|nr:NAD(P)/FAD-dependent oxidoreductase [Candidatus Pacearchaeota archaeon]
MNEKFDTIVIGGGPSGMMAAIFAAQCGGRIALMEANEFLGKKLLLTGGGRCNITNNCPNLEKLLDHYGPKGGFLRYAFQAFGPLEVMNFFSDRGLALKEETGGKIFPKSDKARDVLRILEQELHKCDVLILANAKAEEFLMEDGLISKVRANTAHGIEHYQANNFIIACGGSAYPSTGSDGSIFPILRKLGHKIIPLKPALVPLLSSDRYCIDLQGLGFSNTILTFYAQGKRKFGISGPLIFTHQGLSGPAVLNASKQVGELPLPVMVKIDFFPHIDNQQLLSRLQSCVQKNGAKYLSNCFEQILPARLIGAILDIAMIPPGKKCAELKNSDKAKILELMRNFPVSISGTGDLNNAMVSAGGVDLGEIDAKTMRSKLFHNLFFAGEVLDLDADTGGFNMQSAWSTGYLAGNATK